MKVYFTFSYDDGGGWCEVLAEGWDKAVAAFSEKHPPRIGSLIPCAGIYPEDVFLTTCMAKHGNFGKRCVERINAMPKWMKASEHRVLEYLRTHGSATGKELRDGCHQEDWRKRISELRQDGYKIRDVWETDVNAFGEKTRFKRYWLEEEAS